MDLLDEIVPTAAPATSQKIVVVAFAAEEIEHLGFLMQLSPEVAIVELMRMTIAGSVEVRNSGVDAGYANLPRNGSFKHVCSGCGREFDSNRRQLPGKRSWCGRPECKKEAAALRARDYRDRKAKEGS